MSQWLKQSTAVTIKLGVFVDSTDGVTAETALTISQADIRLAKNGGNIDQSHNAAGATHDELGYYDVPLDTTDTDTLGRLRVLVSEAGALPVWQDFMIVPANVWDSFFGADRLAVDVEEIGAGIITAAAIADAAIDLATFAADVKTGNNLNAQVKAQDNIDFGALQKASLNAATPASVTGAVGSVTGAVGSVTGNVGGNVVGTVAGVAGNVGGNVVGSVGSVTGSVASVTAGVTVTTNNDKTGYALSSAGLQAIWDVLLTAIAQVGSIGKLIKDNLDAAITSRLAAAGYTTPPTVTQIRQEMDANSTRLDVAVSTRLAGAGYTAPDNATITAINAKTTNLPASPAAVGSAMTLTAAYDAAKTAATQASVTAVDDYVDSEVAAIKTVTDRLNGMLELDGAVYRYTTNALEQAPSGGGALTAADVRAEMDANSTKLAQLDATVSSRAAAATALSTAQWTNARAAKLDNLDAPVSSAGGTGSVAFAYTLTDSISGLPIADAEVWATTDAAGTNKVAAGRTDNFGVVTFHLDAGNYFIWRVKAGYTFANPDSEVVV